LPVDVNDVNIYLPSRRLGTAAYSSVIYNSIFVQDLFGKYSNVKVYVRKIIQDAVVDITADELDIQAKIGAYLIENNEYQVWIYSDNNPPFFKGIYSADIVGEIHIVLGSFAPVIDTNVQSFSNNVTMYVVMSNDSTVNTTYINLAYNDSTDLTTQVVWTITNDSDAGELLYTMTSTNMSVFNGQFNMSPYVNTDFVSKALITYNGIVYTVTEHSSIRVMSDKILSLLGQTFTNWIIFLLVCLLAIMGTVKSGNILNLVICGIGAFFVFVAHWWQLSVGVLLLCAIFTVITFLKSRDKEAYYT
jgi:hypothetical protein